MVCASSVRATRRLSGSGRDAGNTASVTAIHDALDVLHVAPSIRATTLGIAERVPALLFPTKAKHYVALVPEDGAQVAVYAQRSSLSVALEPERARHYADRYELRMQEKTPQTWYVYPSASDLQDADVRAAMVEAGTEALERARHRVGLAPDRAGDKRPDPGICVICNYELTPGGVCRSEVCQD